MTLNNQNPATVTFFHAEKTFLEVSEAHFDLFYFS